MMAGIRGKDTKPEMLVRKALHAAGYRYALHSKRLPGRPDIVMTKHNTVIFVHGCFWHGHDCRYFKLPKTRTEFWQDKIDTNRQRDEKAVTSLLQAGWRVCVIWECAQRSGEWNSDRIVNTITDWLGSSEPRLELRE